ncbi:MAG: hypothetical protein EPN92_06545 [Chitinophagaceae bacterium]|nr:MAG: hypothetical protein EPN92_06545 [Chitinophagaceae bacterium]
MKKAFSVILLSLYFAASSGIVINMRYCMNRIDSVEFGAAKTEVCGKCGMHVQESNGCCHNEVKIVKLQDDQQVTSLHYQFSSPDAVQEIPQSSFPEPVVAVIDDFSFNNHSPPLSKQNTYLQNCVFRI